MLAIFIQMTMTGNQESVRPNKMTKLQAIFDILAGFMVVDDKAGPPEEQTLLNFLERYREGTGIDFDVHRELELFSNLNGEGFLQRFSSAADALRTLSAQEKKTIMDLAWDMIAADKRITTEEAELFSLIGEHWEQDITPYTKRMEKMSSAKRSLEQP